MIRSILPPWILAWVAIGAVGAMKPSYSAEATTPAFDRDASEFFENNIRPVLAEHCYTCHSQRAVRVRADLLLDSAEGFAKGGHGGPVVVPGEPENSRLIEAIRWTDAEFQMPPKKQLSPDQIQDFEHWVKMGALYPRIQPSADAPDSATDSPTAQPETTPWWALNPVERPDIPTGLTASTNPIDAFVAADYELKGVTPSSHTTKAALLRRVYLDLIGIPPSPAELDEFMNDTSSEAYENVVDRLLASKQHGVRYARHWLDVFRYADVDERMLAARGIYLWRDWVINALNHDVPYDQFIRAQLTGYRSTTRTEMTATGYRLKAQPRPDDLFALGLLSRGAVIRDGQQEGELAINAVETVSSALMGLTIACAKCHDHVYDEISQEDYYAMKALFDPLVPRRITLATAEELFASAQAAQEAADRRAPFEAKIDALLAPYKQQLYDDRVAMLPDDVRAIVLKPESQRTAEEQKVADDYFPILRIDTGKILEVMPEEDREKYRELERQLAEVGRSGGGRRSSLAEFWSVEVDTKRETEKSYVLTSGDPLRPELDREVQPSWPFAPSTLEFRDGRIEAFSDWLTAPNNPLFARVAVNRIWQWHFGEGLHKSPSDFGRFTGVPSHPKLLDWLASEFVRNDFSMKAMHRLIVTSQTYQLASYAKPQIASANRDADPANSLLWHFPLQRLSAEAIWDSIFTAAGSLDLSVGGPSFSVGSQGRQRSRSSGDDKESGDAYRRAAYMTRGYSTSREVMANFLQVFDVDDGRAPCPQRTQTVTATQGLFMMNSDEIDLATTQFAERLARESQGDLAAAVDLGYRIALARLPSPHERERALEYLQGDQTRLKGLAWLLLNLDEFIYVR